MDIDYKYLIINLILTIILYMTIPMIIFLRKKYEIKNITKICLINSIVVGLVVLIYKCYAFESTSVSGAPIIYFFINKYIFNNYGKKESIEYEEDKETIELINKLKEN